MRAARRVRSGSSTRLGVVRGLILIAALASTGCYLLYPVTPLASAARAGDIKEIDRLAAAGANLDEGSGVNGWPPVIHAIHKGQTVALSHLLELGASISGSTGREALIVARGYGSKAMVRVLLAHGADPRLDGADGHRSGKPIGE